LQKLLRVLSLTLTVLVTALTAVQSAEARSKRRDHRSAAPAAEQPALGKAAREQPRDPADIALEKKIKSICRGC
jgi:hypothetical protein